MKFAVSTLVTLAVCGSAFAAPQATTSAPLMAVSTGGGWSPVSYHHDLVVYQDGRVVSSSSRDGEVISSNLVLTLTPQVVSKLVDKMAGIQKEELTYQHPEAPQCYDAPSTTFSVYKTEGRVSIGAVINCKVKQHSDYTAQSLVTILESFETLSNMAAE